jgi:hypothetical protein
MFIYLTNLFVFDIWTAHLCVCYVNNCKVILWEIRCGLSVDGPFFLYCSAKRQTDLQLVSAVLFEKLLFLNTKQTKTFFFLNEASQKEKETHLNTWGVVNELNYYPSLWFWTVGHFNSLTFWFFAGHWLKCAYRIHWESSHSFFFKIGRFDLL